MFTDSHRTDLNDYDYCGNDASDLEMHLHLTEIHTPAHWVIFRQEEVQLMPDTLVLSERLLDFLD